MSGECRGGYDYAGELADTFDPDEERLVKSIYECRECGALVTYMGRVRHTEWHAKQVAS